MSEDAKWLIGGIVVMLLLLTQCDRPVRHPDECNNMGDFRVGCVE